MKEILEVIKEERILKRYTRTRTDRSRTHAADPGRDRRGHRRARSLVEVIQSIPRERAPECVVEQIVDAPGGPGGPVVCLTDSRLQDVFVALDMIEGYHDSFSHS